VDAYVLGRRVHLDREVLRRVEQLDEERERPVFRGRRDAEELVSVRKP
jgi:hypothetical protein